MMRGYLDRMMSTFRRPFAATRHKAALPKKSPENEIVAGGRDLLQSVDLRKLRAAPKDSDKR